MLVVWASVETRRPLHVFAARTHLATRLAFAHRRRLSSLTSQLRDAHHTPSPCLASQRHDVVSNIIGYVRVNNPIHEIEANEADGKDDPRVLVNITGRHAEKFVRILAALVAVMRWARPATAATFLASWRLFDYRFARIGHFEPHFRRRVHQARLHHAAHGHVRVAAEDVRGRAGADGGARAQDAGRRGAGEVVVVAASPVGQRASRVVDVLRVDGRG